MYPMTTQSEIFHLSFLTLELNNNITISQLRNSSETIFVAKFSYDLRNLLPARYLVFSKSFAHNHLGNCFKNPCISLKIETVTLFVHFFIEPPNSSNCAFDLVTSDKSGRRYSNKRVQDPKADQ